MSSNGYNARVRFVLGFQGSDNLTKLPQLLYTQEVALVCWGTRLGSESFFDQLCNMICACQCDGMLVVVKWIDLRMQGWLEAGWSGVVLWHGQPSQGWMRCGASHFFYSRGRNRTWWETALQGEQTKTVELGKLRRLALWMAEMQSEATENPSSLALVPIQPCWCEFLDVVYLEAKTWRIVGFWYDHLSWYPLRFSTLKL